MRLCRHIFILLALLLAAVSPSIAATDGFRSIVIQCSNPPGRQLSVELDASLTVRYHYGMMEISGRRVYVQIPLENIRSWRFSALEADGVVGAPDVAADAAQVDIRRGSIAVSGLQQPTNVVLCDMGGRVVVSDVASDDYSLDLHGLPAGIYILAVGADSYKICVE